MDNDGRLNLIILKRYVQYFTFVNIYGGASILSTRKCLYESVETVPFGDSSGDGPPRRKQVEVIEPRIATGYNKLEDFRVCAKEIA